MTGFGRSSVDASFGRLIVEIQSVNRKYLEIFVSLPKEFSRFEYDVRKWVGEAVSRGQITIRMYLMPSATSVERLLPDIKLLRKFKTHWEKISSTLEFDPQKIDLNFLIQSLPSLQKIDFADDKDLPVLQHCLDDAIHSFLSMKKREGETLSEDIASRMKEMEKKVSAIEAISPESSQRMKQKLMEKISEHLNLSAETDERLLREIVLYAERVDIAEEITRLRSHFSQFKTLLSVDEGPVGRKMDFLVQEIGREINTIGSKSAEAKISFLVVELKSELEKIREQIQNIE